eukprot:NODE_3749_length_1991_cov_21.263948.p1 GENE.NODE_3749_length_1991_cov_21.263948~~NODE_3749_length_1991_cov_21.263948.p1  ORF type:complete len:558 (-),score=72.71 NODE_3749_length_1991_cov_21.263948:204-1877(-)
MRGRGGAMKTRETGTTDMPQSHDHTEVFLKYLPRSADEVGVSALLRDCGQIEGEPRLLRDSAGQCKGVGWVTFTNGRGAAAACAKSGVLYDERHVDISMAKRGNWAAATAVGGIHGTLQQPGTHTPALAGEVVAAVVGDDREGTYVDGTFGRGGHSKLILGALGPGGRLHAFDMDPEAVVVGKALQSEDARFRIHHCGFKDMSKVLAAHGVKAVSGIFLDLGISSPQLDDAARGFRPEEDGPLDLRFDTTSGQSAHQFLESASRSELLRVLREYGDPSDPHSARRVADAICLARATAAGAEAASGFFLPDTTKGLAELVAACRGYEYQAMNPSKTTFQALRIHLNDEFGQLRGGLAAALPLLIPAGRLGVLTWKHSECTLLVNFLRTVEVAPSAFPLRRWYEAHRASISSSSGSGSGSASGSSRPHLRRVWGFSADVAHRPSFEELRANSRARSAVLHILRKRKGFLCSDLEHEAADVFGWECEGTRNPDGDGKDGAGKAETGNGANGHDDTSELESDVRPCKSKKARGLKKRKALQSDIATSEGSPRRHLKKKKRA